ncbi:Tungstate-binding protein TupA [Campylobacter majalis]|uniref:Tungstate-binding protein TupA n=1 Tax=Campylobacter majalis TaxID=2790656 RepID=A0ABM8Q5A7_9BACT|nr:substrate-binding domain-containing protein [Campylobacter majalis]CAD7288059.1 Tungstate-binding protein TupA [Campylobacter majalis]
MKKSLLLSCLLFANLYAVECTDIYGYGDDEIKVATGSPGELGLLKVISEKFSEIFGVKICWIKAGSGEGLNMLKDGLVDVTMSHSPKLEKELIASGVAKNRTLIGSNEFYIIGPKDDPAKVKRARSAAEAYHRIATSKSLFYTRDDKSGTHVKELKIWELAGIVPSGEWYKSNRDFMTATLKKADETSGYFMSDSSTYISVKNELLNIEKLYSGDKVLVNVYAAMSGINADTKADLFVDFLKSDEAQEMFRNYGVSEYGEAMYNDAKYSLQFFEP